MDINVESQKRDEDTHSPASPRKHDEQNKTEGGPTTAEKRAKAKLLRVTITPWPSFSFFDDFIKAQAKQLEAEAVLEDAAATVEEARAEVEAVEANQAKASSDRRKRIKSEPRLILPLNCRGLRIESTWS